MVFLRTSLSPPRCFPITGFATTYGNIKIMKSRLLKASLTPYVFPYRSAITGVSPDGANVNTIADITHARIMRCESKERKLGTVEVLFVSVASLGEISPSSSGNCLSVSHEQVTIQKAEEERIEYKIIGKDYRRRAELVRTLQWRQESQRRTL